MMHHSSTIALWYASRATGIVCLVLLTSVVLLGLLVSRQGRLPGLPRFGVVHLHRYLSLLAVVFLAVHIITAISDPYVTITPLAVIIPFVSAYKAFWLGLGAVSIDLMAALIVTSLLRARIGRKTWRAVHWTAYAAWPGAVIHGIGAGPDLRKGTFWLVIVCVAAVGAAIGWRAAGALNATPRTQIVPELLAEHGPGDAAEPRSQLSSRPVSASQAPYERIEAAPR